MVVTATGATVTEDGVIDFTRDPLARFKRPTRVGIVDDLPEIETGKVQKYELRERFGD